MDDTVLTHEQFRDAAAGVAAGSAPPRAGSQNVVTKRAMQDAGRAQPKLVS